MRISVDLDRSRVSADPVPWAACASPEGPSVGETPIPYSDATSALHNPSTILTSSNGSAHSAPGAVSTVPGPSGPSSGPFAEATHAAIPALTASLSPAEVVALFERKSQQGKLPGFQRDPSGPGDVAAFRVRLFGAPYDRELIAHVEPGAPGSTVRFTSYLRRRLPWVVVLLTAVSFWPGVLLTDSLLATWFPSWYPKQLWVTCAWYLPLCVLTIPALWKQYKKSERASEEHLRETLAKLAAWLG